MNRRQFLTSGPPWPLPAAASDATPRPSRTRPSASASSAPVVWQGGPLTPHPGRAGGSVSLCDVDSAMLADAAQQVAGRQVSKKTPRTYADYRRMLGEKDLDLVLIATPDHWHALPFLEAVKAGADVYVQKPVSVDVIEGQAMLAAARKYGRVVQVGTQRRSTPHLMEAREQIVKTGRLGKVGLVESIATTTCARRRTRPTSRRRRVSTGSSTPGPRPCVRTTSSSIPAAGAPSWSTATGSWATCASTCSTWSAG